MRAVLFMCALLPSFLRGTEEAYARTDAEVCEFKTLPSARLMVATTPEGYFGSNNQMFGKLFRYIQSNKIPMTAPVEAKVEPGAMYFYCDSESAKRDDLKETSEIAIQSVPERTVAAIGIRGSYSQKSYQDNLTKLQDWLKTQLEYEAIGEPYAVYWNSPFVPGFLKRSEVHIPVRIKPVPLKR